MKKRIIMANVYIILSLITLLAMTSLMIFADISVGEVSNFLVEQVIFWSLGAISVTLFITGTRELTLIRREKSHKEICTNSKNTEL